MMSDEHTGPYGCAHRVTWPVDDVRAVQTTDYWLITAPRYHPLWSQYGLFCVRLDEDVPGFNPPILKFDGATHELLVATLDPESGPHRVETILANALPLLLPVNVVHQFTATDAEMRAVCELAARAVVNGQLCPESSDAPALVREQWLTSIVKTLAHMRGEEHAE
jgi:hypothetical protein